MKDVEEAYRLLNRSIIRVNEGDIEFDAPAELPEEMQDEEVGEERMAQLSDDEMDVQEGELDESTIDGVVQRRRRTTGRSAAGSTAESILGSEAGTEHGRRQKLKLSYEEYRAISNLLVLYIRREEERMEDEGVEDDGLRRSHIVNWYLNEIGDDIDSEAELLQKKDLVEKIISKLIAVSCSVRFYSLITY